ncbi:MAG: hypothetical protein MUO90_01620 [Dehalococcoidales bacterium]|nr:hypothetical protein [Dehalococcoidales bacterium]
MAPRFGKGQRVVIVPAKDQSLSPRDSAIEPYVGKDGKITDYYWIDSRTGMQSIYIYTVKIREDSKEVVVHEDELKAYVE